MAADHNKSVWRSLPILQGILPIQAAQVSAEIVAGLTLAALAIPAAMGYTKIAGTPVVTGLYTLLIPMVLFAVFGSSRHLVVGADSATAAILAAGIAGLAPAGSDEYMALASILAVLAAGFLLLARIIGLGFMSDFLSRTVLIGFLTGVGVQVATGELSGMLGLKSEGHRTIGKVWAVIQQLDQTNVYALIIALAVLTIIVGSRKISKKIPGALIAVVGAIVLSWAMNLGTCVSVLGMVPGGLPRIGLPHAAWSWELVDKLFPTAFAMFVVILTQSAATSRAYAARYHEGFSMNTDLVGLGLANIGAGLSGTFVVNGSPTKTQMIDNIGGRTQLSLLVTAGVVLVVLLFFTAPLAYLPQAVLSAIVFLVGIELIDVEGMCKIYRQRRSEFWVALITMFIVIYVGVQQGIILAMVLSLIDHTRRGYRPKNVLLAFTESGVLRAQPLATKAQVVPGLIIYRFTHSIYYANCEQLSREILELADNTQPPVRWICLDASAVGDVDYSAAEAARSTFLVLRDKGVRLVVAQVLDDVKAKSRYDLVRLFGREAFYETLDDVLSAYQASEKEKSE